jgi:hypothetical protein
MSTDSTHALIIGGTGMLQAASRQIVAGARHATLVARGIAALEQTRGEGSASLVALDYHRTTDLVDRLRTARDEHGPFDLVVLWLHFSAAASFEAVIDLLGEQAQPCRVFDVRGSASADPSRGDDERYTTADVAVDYRRVILGFVRDDEHSRWLTHTEISQGVLDAISADQTEYVVGQVRPWEKRP